MIKFLNLLSDIVDPNWWAEVISKKSGYLISSSGMSEG